MKKIKSKYCFRINFRKFSISVASLVIALSIPISAMEQKVQIESIYFTNAEVPIRVNSRISSNEIPKLRKLAQTAADKAGFCTSFMHATMKFGGYGTACITDSIVVKISEGEYSHKGPSESTRLETITNKLKTNPSEGIDFCLPTHIYKIYIDNKDERDGMGYNIQITPCLKPQDDMWSALRNCLKGNEKNKKTVFSFGKKFGMFQNWGLQPRDDSHDLTFVHKDMNPNNIMLMSFDTDGGNATFKFIDIGDCDDAKSSKGGSLVTDPTFFIYKTIQGSIASTNGITGFLENFFVGYISQLPKDVCKKLKDSFYQYDLDGDNGCYNQMRKDIPHNIDKKTGISKLQSEAFNKAYNLTFPEPPIKQPDPVFKKPEPNNQQIVVPVDFDHQFYLNRTPLLKKAVEGKSLAEQKIAAEQHYINHGKNEGRPYKES